MPLSLPSIPPSLRLAVVGAGALGSELCRLLAELRHPHVLVIDPDLLEARNLPLSRAFTEAAEIGCVTGQPKAELAAAQARRYAPQLAWQSRQAEIADVGLADLRGFDLLLSCTDSTLARLETTFAARTLGLPMLDGGLQSNGEPQGRVTWFAPAPEAACLLCGLPEGRRAELLAYALSPSLGCAAPPHFAPMAATLSTAAAVAHAMLLTLAAQTVTPSRTSFADLLDLRPERMAKQRIALQRSPGCPWHQPPRPGSAIQTDSDEPFARTFERLKQESERLDQKTGPAPFRPVALDLPWPICLRARCLRCLRESAPLRRTAWVRRQGVCPHCAAPGTLEPLATLDTLWPGHPFATRTPAELGLPANQIYSIRPLLNLDDPYHPDDPDDAETDAAGTEWMQTEACP